MRWLWHYWRPRYECWMVLFADLDRPEGRGLASTSEKTFEVAATSFFKEWPEKRGWVAPQQQKRGGLDQFLENGSGLAIFKAPWGELAQWLGQCANGLAKDIHFKSGRAKIYYRSGWEKKQKKRKEKIFFRLQLVGQQLMSNTAVCDLVGGEKLLRLGGERGGRGWEGFFSKFLFSFLKFLRFFLNFFPLFLNKVEAKTMEDSPKSWEQVGFRYFLTTSDILFLHIHKITCWIIIFLMVLGN